MKKEKDPWNLKRLCICLILGGFLLTTAIFLLVGRMTPSPADYSGIDFSEEEYGLSDEPAVLIRLEDDRSAADADSVSISENTVTITEAGTYRLVGTLTDGCVRVEAGSGDTVRLILSGADITCGECPPIYILSAGKAVIIPEDGTENAVTSTVNGGLESAIYSACDIGFSGSGTLCITSENGIAVNGQTYVRISGGHYTVDADSVGIKAQYGVSVTAGELYMTAGTDGIHTTGFGQLNGVRLGAVCLEGGNITIDSGEDAVSAGSVLCVSGGELCIVSGGGSSEPVGNTFGPGSPSGEQSDGSDESAKGLKAETGILITGGTITVDSADDAVHSDRDVTITGGTLTLQASDDGIHGDRTVNITGGGICIGRCSEGIEAHYITIDGGDISVTAADDGLNANAGNNPIAVLAKLLETEIAGTGGRLFINGGTLTVISSGDGLDANGSIVQTGGTVTVNCRSNGADGALDFDGSYSMTGGQLAAFGSSGMMLQTITARKSTVGCAAIGADISEGSVITVSDASGEELLSVVSSAEASCLVLAADTLTTGTEIAVSVDRTQIGSAVMSDESVRIGTFSSSRSGPGGGTSGEMAGNAASGEAGARNFGGMMPGRGMDFLRLLPVVILAAAGALTAAVIHRRRKKRRAAGNFTCKTKVPKRNRRKM